MCCSVHRVPGYVAAGTAVADELMEGVDIKESHASSSADPAVEPSAEVGTTAAPELKTWSRIKELHSRLRELRVPISGTKDVLFRWVCEHEQIAARKRKEEEDLKMRKEGVGGGYRTGDTNDPPWSNSTF